MLCVNGCALNGVQLAIAGILAAYPLAGSSAGETAAVIQLDAGSPGRVFEGIGAVSSG